MDVQLVDPEQSLFVTEGNWAIEGQVAVRGFERLEETEFPILTPRRYALLRKLVVAHTRQRRGIATDLMPEAHRWARDRGPTQVELSVDEYNQLDLRIYEALD